MSKTKKMTDLLGLIDTGNSTSFKETGVTKEDLKYQDYQGNTLLHESARRNRLEITKFLIQEGADYKLTNSAGKTPLDLAWGNTQKYLLEVEQEIVDKDAEDYAALASMGALAGGSGLVIGLYFLLSEAGIMLQEEIKEIELGLILTCSVIGFAFLTPFVVYPSYKMVNSPEIKT